MNDSSEVLAAFELERLLHRASATRFEHVPSGFVCANADLPMVWDASRVQVEPDCEPPSLERLRELAELPSTWHPELRHREVFLSHSQDNRELAYSLAREGWLVSELWLMICRAAPRVPSGARAPSAGRPAAAEGPPRRRAGPATRQRRAVRPLRRPALARRRAPRLRGLRGLEPMALADMYLRGDIAVIEDGRP